MREENERKKEKNFLVKAVRLLGVISSFGNDKLVSLQISKYKIK
jgi:hypothetical protein